METGTRRNTALATSEALLAVVFWGASFVAVKEALREIAPATVVWLRFAIGVAVLAAAVTARRQLRLPRLRDLPYFALLGLLGVVVHHWLQSNGLLTAQASTSAWIIATIPVFAALLGWLVLREPLGRIGVLGIALAAAGVLLVVSRGEPDTLLRSNFGEPGDLLILLSAPNWAIFTVLSRRSLSDHPAARMMFFVMAIGWLGTFVPFVAGPGFADIARLSPQGWLAVLFLGLACTGLGYIFWYDALEVLPVSRVTVLQYLQPLVAMAVAIAIGQETFVPITLAGGAVIVAGVWLVNRRSR